MTSRYRKKALETAQSLQKDTVVPMNQRFGKKVGRGTSFNSNFSRGSELPSHFTARLNIKVHKVKPSINLNAENVDLEPRSKSLMTDLPLKNKLNRL